MFGSLSKLDISFYISEFDNNLQFNSTNSKSFDKFRNSILPGLREKSNKKRKKHIYRCEPDAIPGWGGMINLDITWKLRR